MRIKNTFQKQAAPLPKSDVAGNSQSLRLKMTGDNIRMGAAPWRFLIRA
jgi:hypothetical protein